MKIQKKFAKGFTLLELMIVMIIMGILAVIGIQTFLSSQIKGRDATRKGNLRAITQALELYYNDKSAYPLPSAGGYINACWSGGYVPCDGTDVAHKTMSDGTTVYMSLMPADPVVTQMYRYVSNGKQYQLYAHLENNLDPQIITPQGSPSCGSSVSCNYGVSSANTNP